MISYSEPVPTISRARAVCCKVMCNYSNQDSGNGEIKASIISIAGRKGTAQSHYSPK